MKRPKTDESKCFVCQEAPPVWRCTRRKETFLLCESCKSRAESENAAQNRVKLALRQQEGMVGGRPIFTQLLGGNLNSLTLTFERL